MRNIIGSCFVIIFSLLLTGCVGVENEKTSSNTKITIEPSKISEKEKLLISKTGVEQIEFFELDGTLKEDDDLQFAVELYENGEFKGELLTTWGEPNTKFEDSLISFGININDNEDKSLELIAGIPTGLASTNYSTNMAISSFSKLVGEKIILEKNKPVYLAMWVGTTKNELSTMGSENGELPTDIEEVEIAIVYKVLWTNSGRK